MARTGKPTPAVYRRRRIVVGVAVVAVLALLVAGIVGVVSVLNRSSPSVQSTERRTAEATSPITTPTLTESLGSASGNPSATSSIACDQSKITVTAGTDGPSYQSGQNPVFTLTVTNTGANPCEVNVGTSQMEFVVSSGTDRVFSSKDCQEGAVDLLKTLAPGASERANFTWQRNRSAPGCPAVTDTPGAGPQAYYTLEVSLGGISSTRQPFILAS